MIAFPTKKYNIIYADPAWRYDNSEGKRALRTDKLKRKCGRYTYPSMTDNEIMALPISQIADKECVLFLWSTMPKLESAFKVINAWGFQYKCCAFSWVKTTSQGLYSGLGNWTLGNIEVCLLATHRTFPKRHKPVKQIVLSSVGHHSQKPPEVRKRIVQLLGDLPRIELFAREKIEGWDSWGNQLPSTTQFILAPVMLDGAKEIGENKQ